MPAHNHSSLSFYRAKLSCDKHGYWDYCVRMVDDRGEIDAMQLQDPCRADTRPVKGPSR